jgi:hypothetical protein
MTDKDEEEYETDDSSFEAEEDSESNNESSLDSDVSEVEKCQRAGKKSRKSAAKKTSKKSINITKTSGTRNNTKKSSKNIEKPDKNTKTATSRTKSTSTMAKLVEKRKVTELQIVEPSSKRHRTIERQIRLRMAAAAAEEQDDTFNQDAVEKTVYVQKSRSEAYKVSKIDLKTIRNFVYDKGIVGGSQPALLEELLAEIGVEEEDEVAIREKLKQKVSNVNRTRREFVEMVAEDDIGDVKQRLVSMFKTFGKRAGALEMVQEAIAVLEEFAATI